LTQGFCFTIHTVYTPTLPSLALSPLSRLAYLIAFRMHCASCVKTAIFVLVSAHLKLSVDGVVKMETMSLSAPWSGDSDWLKGLSADHEAQCTVEKECVLGSGLGTCKVTVDPAQAVPLGSTDWTETVAMQNSAESGSITISGTSNTSHWNLCWKSGALGSDRRGSRVAGVKNYCFYVNGICYLWASPCSGGCSHLNLSSYSSFCPTLRYATAEEWSDALPTLNAQRRSFFELCAASQLDPLWNHCDYGVHGNQNNFARVEDGSWNELVLVCAPPEHSATSVATYGSTGPTR